MSRIDEIRKGLKPEQWLSGLRTNRDGYQEQLVNAMVDRDVIEAATELSAARKQELLARMDENILELDARIREIDDRLGAAKEGAMGLPRAARRRLKTEIAKNGAAAEA